MRTATITTPKAPAASKAAPYISLAKLCRDAGITRSQLADYIAQQARKLRAETAAAPVRPPFEPTYTTLKFTLPTSEVCDFMRYHISLRESGYGWHKWRDSQPLVDAVHCFFRASNFLPAERKWWFPFGKPHNGVQSIKGCIERTRKLLKSGPSETIAFHAAVALVGRIDEWALFYGISREEACHACIGYYAAVGRKNEEKSRPKSPMERFERKLASERRQAAHA